MNELTIKVVLACYLLAWLWFSIAKAREDGFFASLCTLAALVAAFTVADREWYFMVNFLREQVGMNELASISAGFWCSFLLVVLPAMLVVKFICRERTPFPDPLERHGSLVAGALVGVVLFAATIQSIYPFETAYNALANPLRPFHPIFNLLGSNWVPR